MKIVYVDVILLIQGRSKENRYITVNERYVLELNFSNFFFEMNSTPIEQKTIVGKCFIIDANRMIYLSCFNLFFTETSKSYPNGKTA